MKIVVIGHRGVGKSSFLSRVKKYLKLENVFLVDLDDEIEKLSGKLVIDIFAQNGEAYFRSLEKTAFESLIKSNANLVVSVGGGFDVSLIPQETRVIWLQRYSDNSGRIFLDRPRLDKNLSALEEFKYRAQKRNIRFLQAHTEQYLMPEGFASENKIEENIFLENLSEIKGILTYLPERSFSFFEKKYKSAGLDFVELRTDLLTSNQICEFTEKWDNSKLLLSHRENKIIDSKLEWQDWALENGTPKKKYRIISLHQREESLEKTFQKINPFKDAHLKLAIEIQNFDELRKGLEWQQEDPKNRNFLPRSQYGRWGWVRRLLKDKQNMNFWREGYVSSSNDQPSLFDWLSTRQNEKFAAVLGSPVSHSQSPNYHDDYFAQKNMNLFAINVQESEWNSAIYVLKNLGLQYAAVTSPLKKWAFQVAENKTSEAIKYQSVNTLFLSEEINGHYTDGFGFEKLIQDCKNSAHVAVWGGGGTLDMMKEKLPKAAFYSTRSGKLREENKNPKLESVQTLVWAAGDESKIDLVPTGWPIQTIIDLSYMENSIARELAMLRGCRYTNGLEMFYEQARKQQEWWSSQASLT